MTIAEASQRWDVSIKTIIGYVADGLIYDITIQNDQLELPNIDKPKIISKNRRGQGKYIYDWILTACRDSEYINAAIIGIDENRFEGCIQQCLDCGYIVRISDTRTATNIGYIITEKGIDRLYHKKKNTSINIVPIFNTTVNTNIGAGNVIM